MALFDPDEATELRELFAAMDDPDESEAKAAMIGAADLLRAHDYSFRHIVQEIDTRGLLLPTKIGAAIKLMDSTTMSEAESALSGARRLMKTCGLTFAGIMGALDREPIRTEDIQDLTLAYRLELERSRELEAELQKLRANAAAVAAAATAAAGPAPAGSEPSPAPAAPPNPRVRNFAVVATLLLGVVLAASIVSTFADMFRAAHAIPPRSAVTMTPTAAPVAVAPATLRQDNGQADRLSPSRTGWNCWRNRGTRGPCF